MTEAPSPANSKKSKKTSKKATPTRKKKSSDTSIAIERSEKSPYPGLQFYHEAQADIFAGREKEITLCARELVRSRVLVLHGPSGCGKSSFLRAGVKPFLARTTLPISFEGNADGFQVIRSTHNPLREFATRLLEVVDDLAKGKSAYGSLRKSVNAKEFKQQFSSPERRDLIAMDSDAAFQALVDVAGAMKTAPIFVIDQAEEIFTLRERRTESETDDADTDEIEDQHDQDQVDAYFQFLHNVASRGAKSRIVISLRTEYKGRFDDRVAQFGHPGEGLRGFYLNELSVEGLKAAITRPTLHGPEWEKIRKRHKIPDERSPLERYGFRLSSDVVDKLAYDLLSDKVPSGGILPALQIACLRLWRQAEEAVSVEPARHSHIWTIKLSNYRRLGKIETQVEEYLAQTLEEAVLTSSRWKIRISDVVEQWHRVLRKVLVIVEADGRAATRRPSEDELVNELCDVFGANKSLEADIRKIIALLASPQYGILRHEKDRITLAHDSLALALYKWAVVFDRRDGAMMRMAMGSYKSSDKLEAEDLFDKDDLPHHTTLHIHEDYYDWDSQLPIFAMRSGFAERLGIRFQVANYGDENNLSVISGDSKAKNWHQLRKRIWKMESDIDERKITAIENGEKHTSEMMLIPTSLANIPGRLDSTTTMAERIRHSRKWTDVLVTDLFVGNAIIGPDERWGNSINDALALPGSESIDRIRSIILNALTEIYNCRGEIRYSGALEWEFLNFAMDIVSLPDEIREYFHNKKNVQRIDKSYDSKSDPIVTWLLQGEAKQQTSSNFRPRYIIGTALSRAIATQAGYSAYFGTQDLGLIARHDITASNNSSQGDIASAYREIVHHTLWQVSCPPAKWNNGINRAFLLRLAGMGYYTAEYVRTNADNFVIHIYNFINNVFSDSAGGIDSNRGVRLNRHIIHDCYKKCYSFLKFEEYGYEVFDSDSIFSYLIENDHTDTKTVADEIYFELYELRRETLSQFQAVADAIGWLRSQNKYDPNNTEIKRITHYKKLGWNNFRIFNFYDSERYMSQAANLSLKLMESTYAKSTILDE